MKITSKLAELQDKVFEQYKNGEEINENDIKKLKRSKWVKWAYKLAPNNLVVRNYCLIDLIDNEQNHYAEINELLKILGKDIWLEGYTYWLYCKYYILEYSKKFILAHFSDGVKLIDRNFAITSYNGIDGQKFPVPFGDLRYQKLEDELQTIASETNCKVGIINKEQDFYTIKAKPIGFNTHIPKKNMKIKIIEGFPFVIEGSKQTKFKFYEGYDKKYGNNREKIRDTFNVKRFVGLIKNK